MDSNMSIQPVIHNASEQQVSDKRLPSSMSADVKSEPVHAVSGQVAVQPFGARDALHPAQVGVSGAMARRHMSEEEVCKVDAMQKRGCAANGILGALRKTRAAAGEPGPSRSAVYRTMRGESYTRGAEEHRGRRANLPPGMVDIAQEVRLRLLDDAKSELMVTWSDIYKGTKQILQATGVLTRKVPMPSEDWFTKTMRAQTRVRARPGKRRITHEKDYKARRAALAEKWVMYPQSWCGHDIHAYIDNKAFVIARTGDMKKRLRTQRVTRHLRTPEEGEMECVILHRKSRSLVGIPSVNITAAVAQDRVIFCHENRGMWNGATASAMYEKLGDRLRDHYGDLPFFPCGRRWRPERLPVRERQAGKADAEDPVVDTAPAQPRPHALGLLSLG